MRVLFRIGVQLVGIVISFLLLVACVSGTEDHDAHISILPSPVPTNTPHLPRQTPLPRYILDTAPLPGSVLSLRDYEQGRHADRGQFITFESASQICVEIDAFWLLEQGDRLVDADQILERVQFTVDDQPIQYPDETLDLAVQSILEDEDGREIGEAGGPFVFCYHNKLDVGLHTVKIKVRKTSGKVLKYKWSFILADPDNYPTSTPVPTGLEIKVEEATLVPRTTSEIK